jgi:hypothetical protein
MANGGNVIEAKLSKSGKTLTIISRLGSKLIEKYYDVTDLQPDPRVARKAYRLEFRLPNDDTDHYAVHVDEFGPACSCADWTFTDGKQACRHITALQQVGLLPKARKQ